MSLLSPPFAFTCKQGEIRGNGFIEDLNFGPSSKSTGSDYGMYAVCEY